LAANVQENQQPDQTLARLQAELAQVQSELSTVSANMARAKTDAQYDAISTVFEELKSRQASLKAMIAAEESKVCRKVDAETEVAAALNLVCRLADLVADANRLDLAAQMFNLCFTRPRTSQPLLEKHFISARADYKQCPLFFGSSGYRSRSECSTRCAAAWRRSERHRPSSFILSTV